MKSSLAITSLLLSLLIQSHSAELDRTFKAEVAGTVHSLSLASNGQIVLGGEFAEVNGTTRNNLARLQADGSLDQSFVTEADGAVFSVVHDLNGAINLGGSFNSPTRNHARLFPNGDVDTTISLGTSTSSRIDCLALGSDGSAVFGGPFRRLNGAPAHYVGKRTSAGAVDATFSSGLFPNPALEAGADAIAVQADGKVLIGGNVNTSRGFAYLVRLNVDGSVDSSFSGDHGPILYTKAIIVLADGRILVAGVANSSSQGFVRRLEADGSVDASFQAPAFFGSVEAIALDGEGGLVAGGSFSGGITRLGPDGSEDTTWDISVNGTVKALAIQGNGAILLGGSFSKIGETDQRGIARLTVKGSKAHQLMATNSNGRFMARIQAEAGKTYEIEASGDFQSWSYIGTATATDGGLEIVDTAASTRKHRFFRAKLVN